MEVKRAYKFRFYPTPQQAEVLARTFGCARFAYNHMLRQRTDAWFQRMEKVNYNQTSAMLTALKKTPEHVWLNEVSSVPVQNPCGICKPLFPTSLPGAPDTRHSSTRTALRRLSTRPARSNGTAKH